MREIRFIRGYDCINFPCRFPKKCVPGNSHGKHGMDIIFLFHGELGAVQFKISTGWMPQKVSADIIGYRELEKNQTSDCYPMPTDLGYHSYTPRYKNHIPMNDKCAVLGGKTCYYDGSGLNASDAFYSLVNGGEDALWKFLEAYYQTVFHEAHYPEVAEYEPIKESN